VKQVKTYILYVLFFSL